MISEAPRDKFERLAMTATHPVVILGNRATADYELVALAPGEPLPTPETYPGRNLRFIGCAGLIGGKPQVALDVPLDDAEINALSGAYCCHIDNRIKDRIRQAVPEGSLIFLEQLWALNDPRPA